ncbi:N-acetyl sugar amidotransferase [Thalassospira xiamenensis]|uniref:N-acetyl sugar amidotransferase n=1 Tax=Thalassospira xiamenensis TaxID=220697 RepID=UPI001C68E812|nr:N-acetyl sugar amidotransferase [Thalassospira xiamenensis]
MNYSMLKNISANGFQDQIRHAPETGSGSVLSPRVDYPRIQFCTKCVYPGVAATPLTFDEHGVCSGCRTHDEQDTVDWGQREKLFRELCEDYRSKDGRRYDCLIPVSGGKDSFYQIHLLKFVYGMNPLLVTYNENNETPVGKRNIQRMKEVFGCDYINMTASIDVVKKMNRIGMRKMGDPDMHCHMGINAVPIQMAVRFQIPLIIWGEHGFMNLGGMHSYKDMVEYTARYRKEHLLRGYDWDDFVGEEGLTEQDMLWAKYPSDQEIEDLDVRGVFISNFFGWKQHEHTKLMVDLYGFELNPIPFDRTYSRDANLNNFHDNGIHDYMKYIKFGYGRVHDHVSRDIRNGLMSRDEGVALCKQYEGVVPGDLPRWLDYVGWTRTEFEKVADTFRDPKVWVKNEYGDWIKDAVWLHN